MRAFIVHWTVAGAVAYSLALSNAAFSQEQGGDQQNPAVREVREESIDRDADQQQSEQQRQQRQKQQQQQQRQKQQQQGQQRQQAQGGQAQAGQSQQSQAGQAQIRQHASETAAQPQKEGQSAPVPQYWLADAALFISNAWNTTLTMGREGQSNIQSPQIFSSQAEFLTKAIDRALEDLGYLNENASQTQPQAVPPIRYAIGQLQAARAQSQQVGEVSAQEQLGPTYYATVQSTLNHLASSLQALQAVAQAYGAGNLTNLPPVASGQGGGQQGGGQFGQIGGQQAGGQFGQGGGQWGAQPWGQGGQQQFGGQQGGGQFGQSGGQWGAQPWGQGGQQQFGGQQAGGQFGQAGGGRQHAWGWQQGGPQNVLSGQPWQSGVPQQGAQQQGGQQQGGQQAGGQQQGSQQQGSQQQDGGTQRAQRTQQSGNVQ